MDDDASAAVPCDTAIFASATCRSPHSLRNCRVASTMKCPCPPLYESSPPCVFVGRLPPRSMFPSSTNAPPSPAPQKPMFSSVTIAVLVNESYSSSTSTSSRPIPAAANASSADSPMGNDVMEGAWYGL